jgi:hypothetical protein
LSGVSVPSPIDTACSPPPPPAPPPLREKTIDAPSGVQVMIDEGAPGGRVTGSVHSPEVNRFASPPAAGAIHTCVGGSGAVMKR